MSTTATTHLPPGIYRIVVAGGGGLESQRLTNTEEYVTVLPPSVDNDPLQEWRIEHDSSEDDTIIISYASPIFPYLYLTYNGPNPHEKPKAGNHVVAQRAPFPPNKWRVKLLPIFRALIQVDGSDLGIAIAPPKIHPPFLELKNLGQLEWRFEFVRKG